ncbi:tudor domain-containing 6-like isoform X1 [Labrus bergylta]|uniref:tudor domain-containing 6-like isoform X1 n=1 Tax=Labrus bergylta TaxID=56723 RepID=UPI003313CB01
MGDERKHIYAQMREEIQIPKKKFNGSEGKPADLCLVCISDTWHRARIVSSKGETYNVYLIDQGQPHITTSEALAWGQSDSFLLPPEIEACILANVLSLENSWPEKASKFLKSLHGKTFKGLVQHVLMADRIILLDISIVSKYMCKFGVARKVPADEFKCLVQERLHFPKGVVSEVHLKTHEQNLNVGSQLNKSPQYFYPERLTETYETVIVTEITNPESIFCCLQTLSKTLKTLSEEINQHYEASSDFGEAQPQTCGDPCAAKGKNGRWNRSLLRQNLPSDGTVEVLHVDEGKTKLVRVGDIKPLHEKFLRMPVFTYRCSLDGVKNNGAGWTNEQTDHLKSILLNKTVLARFNCHDKPQDVYHVTLYEFDEECINDRFIKKTGLSPPLKSKGDSDALDEPIVSSIGLFVHSLGNKQGVDFSNGLLEEEANNIEVNGRSDDVDTSCSGDIDIKENSEHSDPAMLSNMYLPTSGFHFVMQNGDDDMYTEGKSMNVTVSCIESLQKFWCQKVENGNSLQLLMQDLQNHYASNHPEPLVESICVARNPDNNKWCRARIMTSHHSPVVDVRFIDYGHTVLVPLRDVRPIDPAFLRPQAQAFQCCLLNQKTPSHPTAITGIDDELAEFQKFVDLGASSNTGFKCVVQAVTSDEEGLPLNVVDFESSSHSVCKLLTQQCAQAESQEPISTQVQSDGYKYSGHKIEVGGREKVFVTSSENVNHFYCQLDRNSDLFDEVIGNVKKQIGKPQCKDHQLGLESICFARYTDNHWHRAQVVEMSPKLKVHFVDYGNTLAVNGSDVCHIPIEASFARSAPVQAVPLGLYDVPPEVPQEVNQWFADHAVSHSFTVSVVAKDAKGKLIVELFDGSVNVNMKVREMVLKMTQQKIAKGPVQQTEQQLSKHSKDNVPNKDWSTEELMNPSELQKMTEENQVHSNNGMFARAELQKSSQSITNVSATQVEHKMILDEGTEQTLEVINEAKESVLVEVFIQGGQSDSEMDKLSLPSDPKINLNIYNYKRPDVSLNKTEEVYASCIVGPNYFWCQNTNTEDLNIVSRLAQDAGNTQNNVMFSETLGPGGPCLALYSSDNQWYRAQVIQSTESLLHVLFIDYGNEAEVDIDNVRPLPQSLLEKAPQAFLCSLNGFDESKGSWDDRVYDDFHNLLVDKLLRVTVFNVEDHSEMPTPQCAVQIECDNLLLNQEMQKYWKTSATEHIEKENAQLEDTIQESPTEFNSTCLNVCTGNVKTMYKTPNISKNKKEDVYASCIVEPQYFWCQYTNTEELDKIWKLVQEAGQAQQENMLLETLVPGSPCLALFSSDDQWYRAQVISKVDNVFHVVFIDYGNEADVNLQNVRPLPRSLLDQAPQAFLCSLNGFDLSEGSWNDNVYEDFYNLLVDKPLKLNVLNMENHSEILTCQYAVEMDCEGVCVNAAMQKYWKTVSKDIVLIKSPQTDDFLKNNLSESNTTQPSFSKGNMNICMYKKPNVAKTGTEMMYASCIAEPSYFWCQYTNTQELDKVAQLAQEAGKEQQDRVLSETLDPGSPCLALFSSDDQWYRAQVISIADDTFHVLFIDYGNESDIAIKNVIPLPQSLLDQAPQALLCSLNGFDESKGSWEDGVYEDFYNLLVDKPLKLTVLSMDYNSKIAFPQYKVDIERDGVVVNTLMDKYWKDLNTDHSLAGLGSVNQDEEEC